MQAMSATTTLTLHTVASTDRLERSRFQPNSIPRLKHSSNKNKAGISNREVHTSSSYIKCQSFDAGGEKQPGIDDNNSYSSLSKVEDAVLLGRSQSEPTTMTASLLHKSSSCNAMLKPKSTVITQDSKNGRININSAVNEKDFSISLNTDKAGAVHELDFSEQDAFLLDDSGTSSSSRRAASNSTSRRSSLKSNSISICYRIHGFINRNWHLSYLVPFSILLALLFVAYLTRGYATQLLYWIETQDPWMMFAVFVVLFIIVSFPVAVGYFVLMITSGYLFGCIKGLLTVMLGANLGIAIAHVTIRSVRHRIPMHKLIKNETGRAILRVISGPRAFRVVLFTRLTPIPFGIQNVIFGVSSIKPRIYHTATFLGLLPAQTINVYLGSTLRSMHEVLNNHGTALTGYISFGVEAICGIALMFWVVQKARKELSETLLSDISNDGKLINMQV